jgi:uncharacterized protein involved in response to NO
MLKIHSEPPKPDLAPTGPAWLALGFRPFFILAGVAAVALITTWLAAWGGQPVTPDYYGPILWHSHEMLFGYTTAVIAGFLLTAVRNWTGVDTPTGYWLGLLVLLWIAGRFAPLAPGILPAFIIAGIDLAFLPAVALAIRPALWKGPQKMNRIFVPILAAMMLANLLVHLQTLGITSTAGRGIDMMLYMVVMLVLMIGGRVMPFFTQGAIPDAVPKRYPKVEIGTFIVLCILIAAGVLYPEPWIMGSLALLLAATQVIRVAGWHHPKVWGIPILWVLYTSFIWIIAGFVMTALAYADVLNLTQAKHALTIGGIGVLTLGMMSRVSLGHTGRSLQASPLMTISFITANVAALARVGGPLLLAQKYNLWIHISGGLWIVSFVLFCAVYLPVLSRPRVDGKPG